MINTIQTPANAPDWVKSGFKFLGLNEHKPEDSKIIQSWFSHTTIRDSKGEVPDGRTSWCAVFISELLRLHGLSSHYTASSLQFLRFNEFTHLAGPKNYCLVVFDRGGGFGHIGICLGSVGDKLAILGGNQSDKVCIIAYSRSKAVGFLDVGGTSAPLTPYKGSVGLVSQKDEDKSWSVGVK